MDFTQKSVWISFFAMIHICLCLTAAKIDATLATDESPVMSYRSVTPASAQRATITSGHSAACTSPMWAQRSKYIQRRD